MKYVIVCLAAFVSFNALACPDLAGRYNNCMIRTNYPAPLPLQVLKIEQEERDGATVYTVNSFNLDGQRETSSLAANGNSVTTRKTHPEYGAYQAVTSASCQGDVLVTTQSTRFTTVDRALSIQQRLMVLNGHLLMNFTIGTEWMGTLSCAPADAQ